MQGVLTAIDPCQLTHACAFCGGQLAVIGGVLRKAPGGGVREQDTRDERGRLPDHELEPGPDGTPSARARRGQYVGCGHCRVPVPRDHPRQARLDREWAERDVRDQAEAERRGRQKAPPTIPHINAEQYVNDQIAPLCALLEAIRVENAELKAEVAALKAAGRKR